MIIYHVINSDAVDSTLQNGLLKTSRGEKGDDAVIVKTDTLLDDLRPEKIRRLGLSRNNNIYGYLPKSDKVINIQNGECIDLRDLPQSHQTVLRLNVDPKRCYISNLDIYDSLKNIIQKNKPDVQLEKIASKYWNHVIQLNKAGSSLPRRPEVMVTYDIPPSNLQIVIT